MSDNTVEVGLEVVGSMGLTQFNSSVPRRVDDTRLLQFAHIVV